MKDALRRRFFEYTIWTGVLGKSVRLRKCPGGQFWDVWNVFASAINERTSGERSLSFYVGWAVFTRSKSRYEDHIGHLDAVFLFSAVFNKT